MFRQICMMELFQTVIFVQSSKWRPNKVMFRQTCMMELFQTAVVLDRIFMFCQAPTHFVRRGSSGVMTASV